MKRQLCVAAFFVFLVGKCKNIRQIKRKCENMRGGVKNEKKQKKKSKK